MTTKAREPRVLSIDPTSRGFGYAVLEGPARLVDWGVTEGTRADNRDAARRVDALLARYDPDNLVLEDTDARQSRRRTRVRRLLVDLMEVAQERRIQVKNVSREAVRSMFASAEARNKEQIADAITAHFPELARWRPPIRKPWMSEDGRMAIFDAVAFGLTYFYFEDEKLPCNIDYGKQNQADDPGH